MVNAHWKIYRYWRETWIVRAIVKEEDLKISPLTLVTKEEAMKCPKCNEELGYDEVDIGVRSFTYLIMRGNYHCDNCGWSDRSVFTIGNTDDVKE